MASSEPASLLVLHFVGAIADECRRQFPRHCPACGERYGSFEDYLSRTTALGCPMEYDSAPDDPFGIVDFANCRCGTTLSVRWEGPPSAERAALRHAIAHDATQTGVGSAGVLILLRDAIRRTVLGETSR